MTSWLESTQVAGAPNCRMSGEGGVDDRAQFFGLPWALQEVEVEAGVQAAVLDVAHQPLGAVDPGFGDECPVAGIAVGDLTPGAVDVLEFVAVPVRVLTRQA